MDAQIQILHDLTNILLELQRHAEILMNATRAQGAGTSELLRARSLHSGIQHMGNLLEEYRELLAGARLEDLGSLPFCDWSDYLQDEVFPLLANFHGIDILFESKLKSRSSGIIDMKNSQRICENLIANAVTAGAKRLQVELLETDVCFDLIFRDYGCGMSEGQIQQLGLGFSTKSGAGHGQGFRIILKLAAETGAIVRTPKSISGLGTEICVSFMKVGAAMNPHDNRAG